MNANDYAKRQLEDRREGTCRTVQDFLAPLYDLSRESTNLITGFGAVQNAVRKDLIPYFHVCGATKGETPARVLILGGLVGTETATALAVAQLLVTCETLPPLMRGVEVTAYPILNVEAFEKDEFLTDKQKLYGIQPWQDSPSTHVQVAEAELRRYAYDLVIQVREEHPSIDLTASAWADTPQTVAAMADLLGRIKRRTAFFDGTINPRVPGIPRQFTPVPGSPKPVIEVAVGLPGSLPMAARCDAGAHVMLELVAGLRIARLEAMI